MSVLSVNNIKKHFDNSVKHINFAVFNLNISIMRHFTIFRSTKSQRVVIYNKYGAMMSICESMNAAFDFFYKWCGKLGFQSVSYYQTKDKNVIRVKMF